MANYKWATPYEWLQEKASTEWTPDQVLEAMLSIAMQTDPDTLQDIFESDMDEDGYFDKICRVCGQVESLHDGEDKECPVQTRVGTDYFVA